MNADNGLDVSVTVRARCLTRHFRHYRILNVDAKAKRPIRMGERGQVLPFFITGVVAVVGVAALAVDTSYWRYEQRAQQAAADTAAIAGAIQENYAASGVTTAALAASATNGFTNDGVTTFVTVNVPPTTR